FCNAPKYSLWSANVPPNENIWNLLRNGTLRSKSLQELGFLQGRNCTGSEIFSTNSPQAIHTQQLGRFYNYCSRPCGKLVLLHLSLELVKNQTTRVCCGLTSS